MTTKLILSFKLSLISLTILSSAMLLKLYLPFITEFFISQLPMLWSSMQSWFMRPYLYVLLNFIIISIAASSRFQHRVDEHVEHVEDAVPGPIQEPAKVQPEFHAGFVVSLPEYQESVVLKSPVKVYPEVAFKVATTSPVVEFQEVASEAYRDEEAKVLEMERKEEELVEEGGDKSVVLEAKEIPKRTESMEILMGNSFSTKKPPVSAKFAHRKLAKAHPEGGKSLKVSKPKRQDTLENTWKMITEGRSMPLARHLKKSDTMETKTQVANPILHDQVKKSESFNVQNTTVSSSLARSQGSGKLRKQPSPSQDELNRRVEAFINKFNEEMRLQRLESLNRYKEMMSPGEN